MASVLLVGAGFRYSFGHVRIGAGSRRGAAVHAARSAAAGSART